MKIYKIDGSKLTSSELFHSTFAEIFEFPSYYGRNMDAWIDCMSDIESPICIQIDNVEKIKNENITIYNDIIECSAFINWRLTNEGKDPLIVLSFYK